MSLKQKFSRLLSMCRDKKASDITSSFDHELSGSIRKPLLALALGHHLNHDGTDLPLEPFIGYSALHQLATLIVDKTYPKSNSNEYLEAARLGEIGAIHVYAPEDITIDSVQQARYIIQGVVNESPLDEAQLITFRDFVINSLRQTNIFISKEDFSCELGISLNKLTRDKYPLQKLFWYKYRGNVGLENALFREWSQEWRDVFASLTDLNDDNFQTLPNTDPARLVDNLKEAWQQLTNYQQLGIYEGIGWTEEDQSRRDTIMAFGTYVLSLVEGRYITKAGVNHLCINLETVLHNLNLHPPTHKLFLEYASLYPKHTLNVDFLYNCITRTYDILDDKELESILEVLKRVLIRNHIFSLKKLADALLNLEYFPFYILEHEIGIEEFTSVATLIGWILFDKFGSLISPPVPIKSYANLLYTGVLVSSHERKIARYNTGIIDFSSYLTKRFTHLERLAEHIYNLSKIRKNEALPVEAEAFLSLCRRLSKTVGPIDSNILLHDRTEQRKRKLSDEVINELKILQVEISPEWTDEKYSVFEDKQKERLPNRYYVLHLLTPDRVGSTDVENLLVPLSLVEQQPASSGDLINRKTEISPKTSGHKDDLSHTGAIRRIPVLRGGIKQKNIKK